MGAADSSEILFNTTLTQGAKLASLRGLSDSSYVTATSSSHSGAAPTLQFDIEYNTPSVSGYNGRLVFDPGLLGSAVTGTWQNWDAVSGDAWYFTKAPGNANCQLNNASYCGLSEVLAMYPGLTLLDVLFKAGGSVSSFNGSVDAFVYKTSDSASTFDFEPMMEQATCRSRCRYHWPAWLSAVWH